MNMTRATILEKNLDDKLWPEIILAMTYVKNVHLTKALNGDNLTTLNKKASQTSSTFK